MTILEIPGRTALWAREDQPPGWLSLYLEKPSEHRYRGISSKTDTGLVN